MSKDLTLPIPQTIPRCVYRTLTYKIKRTESCAIQKSVLSLKTNRPTLWGQSQTTYIFWGFAFILSIKATH